jgi:hypothetical protein
MLSAWQNEDHSDWQARLAARQFLPSPAGNRPSYRQNLSTISSANATRPTRSSVSSYDMNPRQSGGHWPSPHLHPINRVPSLDSRGSSISEASSASTGYASNLFPQSRILEQGSDGILVSGTVFECPFWFLQCGRHFSDEAEWRDHALTHFRRQRPPRNVQCPLRHCNFRMSSDDGYHSWDARMEHVAEHHWQGENLADSRPDFHLFDYLWKIKVISSEELKELKGNFEMTRSQQYDVTPARTTREDRNRSYPRSYWNI